MGLGSVLNKEARYSTKEEIGILVDILTASILENEMCPGPFSGTEANWHGTAWVRTARLSLEDKVAGGRLPNGLGSWPVPIPRLCLGSIWERALWYRLKCDQEPLTALLMVINCLGKFPQTI